MISDFLCACVLVCQAKLPQGATVPVLVIPLLLLYMHPLQQDPTYCTSSTHMFNYYYSKLLTVVQYVQNRTVVQYCLCTWQFLPYQVPGTGIRQQYGTGTVMGAVVQYLQGTRYRALNAGSRNVLLLRSTVVSQYVRVFMKNQRQDRTVSCRVLRSRAQ